MDLLNLHREAVSGDLAAEQQLFAFLAARFGVFAQQRIWARDDAQDVVQDALATIAVKYKTVEIETSFVAWAHQVLSNKIMDYVKAKSRRTARFAPDNDCCDTVPAHGNSDPDLRLRLLDCLKKVDTANKRHARILALHYQGYTVAEICAQLGLTQANFYSVLSRARSMLKACLDTGGIA